MATGKMYSCEVKILYKVDDKKELRWVERSVSNISGGKRKDIRCMHCNGAVRVHKQQVAHGPGDHVEHKLRQDSENCKGGTYFNGIHSMSNDPVV